MINMRFLTGFVFALILVPVLVYCYFRSVLRRLPPLPPHGRMKMRLAHMALDARIDKEAPKAARFNQRRQICWMARIFIVSIARLVRFARPAEDGYCIGMYPTLRS